MQEKEINGSEVERLNAISSREVDMLNLSNNGQNHLMVLSRYMEGKFDVKGVLIREKAWARKLDL